MAVSRVPMTKFVALAFSASLALIHTDKSHPRFFLSLSHRSFLTRFTSLTRRSSRPRFVARSSRRPRSTCDGPRLLFLGGNSPFPYPFLVYFARGSRPRSLGCRCVKQRTYLYNLLALFTIEGITVDRYGLGRKIIEAKTAVQT